MFGGRSEEHEISLLSARSVAQALEAAGHQVVPFGISKGGVWLDLRRSHAALDSNVKALLTAEDKPLALSLRDALTALTDIDVAFPLVHGRTGEDGVLDRKSTRLNSSHGYTS